MEVAVVMVHISTLLTMKFHASERSHRPAQTAYKPSAETVIKYKEIPNPNSYIRGKCRGVRACVLVWWVQVC